jgi:2-polyprenyl-3-methyl-5-hydroxy-6-metoxy-1,4-benzoquinol methylase
MTYIKTKLRQLRWQWKNRKAAKAAKTSSNSDIFSQIYSENRWGKTLNQDGKERFFSGSGSHDQEVVANYVGAIQAWVAQQRGPIKAVDVGCGDFNIGSRLVPVFDDYLALDVVPELIEFNRQKWSETGARFMVADITADEIPGADVVLVREVFQHLSNQHIASALKNISNNFGYLLLTESRPRSGEYVANLDKPTGPGTRSQFGSGLDVQKPPFSLECKSATTILSQVRGDRQLDTIVYELGS